MFFSVLLLLRYFLIKLEGVKFPFSPLKFLSRTFFVQTLFLNPKKGLFSLLKCGQMNEMMQSKPKLNSSVKVAAIDTHG